MTRGHCLILEPSPLYLRGAVLRDPLTLQTVATPKTRKAAIRWCQREHYSWMPPVKNVSMASLEEHI